MIVKAHFFGQVHKKRQGNTTDADIQNAFAQIPPTSRKPIPLKDGHINTFELAGKVTIEHTDKTVNIVPDSKLNGMVSFQRPGTNPPEHDIFEFKNGAVIGKTVKDETKYRIGGQPLASAMKGPEKMLGKEVETVKGPQASFSQPSPTAPSQDKGQGHDM